MFGIEYMTSYADENDNQMYTYCQQYFFWHSKFQFVWTSLQYRKRLISFPILTHSQREDWRLRPLTPEMIEYARTDAHYLLYIANCLASELRAKACGMF